MNLPDYKDMSHKQRMHVLGITVRARMDANVRIADGMRRTTNGDPSGMAGYRQGIEDHKAAATIAGKVRYN